MAHTNELIYQINLGGTIYDICDKHAIHTLADLAALGIDVEGAFIFKGTVATFNDLPKTGNKIGYVYHVTDTHTEYVWAKVDGNTSGTWEEFGEHFVVNHVHQVTVTGHNAASAVSGEATVTGANQASSVTVKNAPKVTEAKIYAKIDNTNTGSFVTSYPGVSSKLMTTSITPAGTATSVINSVTAPTGSITGVSGVTEASKAIPGTTKDVAKVGDAVAIPNVTKVDDISVSKVTKAAASTSTAVNASVSGGVLTLTPLTVATEGDKVTISDKTVSKTTLGTAISITPAVANGQITPYTFTKVDVPIADSAASTFVTNVQTGSANVATVGSSVTVATGSLGSNGSGSSVLTGLGTASTASALKGATLVAGTSTDGFFTGDDVTISTQDLSGTAAAQVWTQNTGSISGTAAAQVWTQDSGITGEPQSV